MHHFSALRQGLAGTGQAGDSASLPPVATGHALIDAALGGGVARGRLHEVFAATGEDASSAAGFAVVLARLIGGPLLWLRVGKAEARGGRLHAPGLNHVGFDPASAILGVLPDPVSVLRAGIDAARCPQVGVALIELWQTPRELDQVASRRLAVAAQKAGTTVLLLRIDAAPSPSVAQTRWSVAAAPSLPFEAEAPGHATFDVELIRQRGRPETGLWRVAWDRDGGAFRDAAAAPVPGVVLPDAIGGSLPADAGTGWRRVG